ncbi:hypothetical protein Unana1_03252 [Umbelopsis nana]
MYTVLDRDIPECPVRIVSTAYTDKRSESVYAAKLRQLLVFVRLFRKQDFWTELAVWDRIYYKNVNQHRQSRYFKKFGEVRKLMKRLKDVNPSSEISKLYTSFYDESPLAKCKGPNTSSPTIEYANYSLHRIISATLLLDRIQVTCIETYRAHQHLLNKKYFLPLTLVIMGLCSRTFSTCKSWAAELEEFYEFLIEWKADFPADPKNSVLSYKDIDKDSLGNGRRKAFKEFCSQRTSEFQPVHLESGNLAADVRDITFETLLEEPTGDITIQDRAEVESMLEDYGEVLSRDNISVREGSTAIDAQPRPDSSAAGVEVKQTIEKKRKANDSLSFEIGTSIKSSVSVVEKAKKKKKRKVVIADQRSDSEAVKGDKHESGNTSKLKQSENVNMGMKKVKSKMKSKPAVDRKSKGAGGDEIDDIFGF